MTRFFILLPFAFCLLPSIAFAVNQKEALEWLLLREDYETLGERAENLSKENPRSEYVYLAGLGYLKSSNFDEAREQFQEVAQNHPKSPEVEKALIGIADSYYLEGKTEEALERYLAIHRKYRKSPWGNYVVYRLGQCYQSIGYSQSATWYFEHLIQEAPHSPEAKLAQVRLKEGFLFSVQVGVFSDSRNANRMDRLLRSKGFQPFIAESEEGGQSLYRIRVGQFITQKEAIELANRLKEEGFSARVYP